MGRALTDAEIAEIQRGPHSAEQLSALCESYAVLDHLTTGHRARGCNPSCDWWERVEAIRNRNKR